MSTRIKIGMHMCKTYKNLKDAKETERTKGQEMEKEIIGIVAGHSVRKHSRGRHICLSIQHNGSSSRRRLGTTGFKEIFSRM